MRKEYVIKHRGLFDPDATKPFKVSRSQIEIIPEPVRHGSYAYADTDFDITACIALPLERVLFFPGVHASIRRSTANFLRAWG